MEMTNVQPMFEPDPVQMRRHVGHLFEGWLDGCQEGRIELAWTDVRDGKLRHAAIFGTDGLDDLVERAVAENRRPGQNLYIGQALRQPGIAPFGRCGDDEVFALTAFYVDIDDDVTATASINYRNRGCPPTSVVVTGRHPHVRAQMLWRLDAPLRDLELCRQQNAALAQALDGDPSVVNPSRVMRLGGSIAWPLKEGRVIERTEFLDFDDGRPKVYIAAIRAGDHWHDNMLRLVGHWISRGMTDEEILSLASTFTLAGYLTAAEAENGEEPNPDARVLTRKKSNYARAGETLALRWSDGVMVPLVAEASSMSAVTERVLAEVDRAWQDGQPYSDAPQARSRFILTRLPARTGLGRKEVERAYLALLDSGHLRVEQLDRHRNLRGLKVTRRMDELKGASR